jgi:tRNA threonylcarbamoyladenosine biosynthesis protein TsaE
MEWIFSLDQIGSVAELCWNEIGDSRVIALHGKMGAGKTTFIHALCEKKGIASGVTSPTFSIINEYVYQDEDQQKKIYHIDLYRLKDEQEAILAGVEDCLYSGHYCFVEWPEIAPGIFPKGATLDLAIEVVDTVTRKLKIGGN